MPSKITPKPKSWSWLIPNDQEGNSLDKSSETQLLRGFTSRFHFHVLHNGKGNPRNLKILRPRKSSLEGSVFLVMNNVLNTPPQILNEMGAFLTGYLCDRKFKPTSK